MTLSAKNAVICVQDRDFLGINKVNISIPKAGKITNQI